MHPVSNVPAMPEVAEDEVLENERFFPLKGFKSSHLMGLDPKRCFFMLSVCACVCGSARH